MYPTALTKAIIFQIGCDKKRVRCIISCPYVLCFVFHASHGGKQRASLTGVKDTGWGTSRRDPTGWRNDMNALDRYTSPVRSGAEGQSIGLVRCVSSQKCFEVPRLWPPIRKRRCYVYLTRCVHEKKSPAVGKLESDRTHPHVKLLNLCLYPLR